MSDPILLDTGPLLAYLNARDQHHAWAREVWAQLSPPLLTCEPVLTEAAALLASDVRDATPVLELVRRRTVQVALRVEDEAEDLAILMRKYRNLPMSLVDACLVRLSEIHRNATVLTVDSDFLIYRRHGRLVIPTLMPPSS